MTKIGIYGEKRVLENYITHTPILAGCFLNI